jgi:phage gp29-like protein
MCIRDRLNGPWIWNPDCNISARTAPPDRYVPMEMFLARTVPRPLDLIALPLFCKCALAEKDWAAYVEIFGIPGGVVVGPPNVPKDKEKAYEAAAKAVAAGGVGYVPNGAEWKPNNPPHSGAPFSEFLRYQHEQLVLAGTGGQLTMLAESGSGTLAGTAHQETFQKIARAEGARISADVFQRQLDKPYLERLFPGKPICAYFELDIRQSPTTKEVISDVKELAAAGYPVDPEEVSERTGYEIITKDSVDPTVPPSDPTQAQDPAAPADPQNPMPEEKPITNRKTLAESAVDLVARSVASDLQPISDKLQSILDLNDPAAQRQGLIRFLEDMPKEAQTILSNPSSAESIANVMSTAAVNGLLNSAANKK